MLPDGFHYITAITKPQIKALMDLALVEKAFHDCKTTVLEVRPVFVRREEGTRGHVLVVMLAYMIIRRLREAWSNMNLTVKEGLSQLATHN